VGRVLPASLRVFRGCTRKKKRNERWEENEGGKEEKWRRARSTSRVSFTSFRCSLIVTQLAWFDRRQGKWKGKISNTTTLQRLLFPPSLHKLDTVSFFSDALEHLRLSLLDKDIESLPEERMRDLIEFCSRFFWGEEGRREGREKRSVYWIVCPERRGVRGSKRYISVKQGGRKGTTGRTGRVDEIASFGKLVEGKNWVRLPGALDLHKWTAKDRKEWVASVQFDEEQ
jgi:hypothetical protein